MYFGVLKKLYWVEPTGETEDSGIQDNYSNAPSRVYYRLTQEGKAAGMNSGLIPYYSVPR